MLPVTQATAPETHNNHFYTLQSEQLDSARNYQTAETWRLQRWCELVTLETMFMPIASPVKAVNLRCNERATCFTSKCNIRANLQQQQQQQLENTWSTNEWIGPSSILHLTEIANSGPTRWSHFAMSHTRRVMSMKHAADMSDCGLQHSRPMAWRLICHQISKDPHHRLGAFSITATMIYLDAAQQRTVFRTNWKFIRSTPRNCFCAFVAPFLSCVANLRYINIFNLWCR